MDLSEYNTKPSNYLLEVKFPSLSQIYDASVKPSDLTIVTTSKLCYSKGVEEFPDGIYEFTYSITPNSLTGVKKYYLSYTQAKEKLAKYIAEALKKGSLDQKLINKIYELEILMKGSEELASTGKPEDIQKALQAFDQVEKELKKLDPDNLCNKL